MASIPADHMSRVVKEVIREKKAHKLLKRKWKEVMLNHSFHFCSPIISFICVLCLPSNHQFLYWTKICQALQKEEMKGSWMNYWNCTHTHSHNYIIFADFHRIFWLPLNLNYSAAVGARSWNMIALEWFNVTNTQNVLYCLHS
jgi:hypothetical protein